MTRKLGIALGILLCIGCWALYRTSEKLMREKELLQQELDEYKQREGQSYVVERISKQMEDIAYQQKSISDKQREEAIYQMGVAEEMRLRAEGEQRKAQAFANNAEEERIKAESQRQLANQQRQQAEYAKTVADTLSYVAMGRSLASFSDIQYQAENFDLAALLAYASWKYTSDYKGDVYLSTIYNALSQNCGSYLTENIHRGGVVKIIPLTSNTYLSVSKYGEISRWSYEGTTVKSQQLFSNPALSFRDVCTDEEGTIFALSYDGVLLVVDKQGTASAIPLAKEAGMKQLAPMDARTLLIAAGKQLYIYDKGTKQISRTIDLPQRLSTLGKKEGEWLVFGNEGGVWRMDKLGNLIPEEMSVNGTATTYTYSPELKQAAIGTEKGEIFLMDNYGNTLKRIIGHNSRVTQVAFKGHHLISSSYDCSINMWDLSVAKQEKITLRTLSSWAYCFSLSEDNNIWTGEESGFVSRFSISPDDMAKLIHSKLTRDFTDDEWAYYIGDNVPRRSMINP